MAFEHRTVIFSEAPTFDDLLDTACERLREKQIQYSIRRIGEMDEELNMLEKKLEEFIQSWIK